MVVAPWQPPWAWHAGLVALRTVTYFVLFVPLYLRELGPFLGKNAEPLSEWRKLASLTMSAVSSIFSHTIIFPSLSRIKRFNFFLKHCGRSENRIPWPPDQSVQILQSPSMAPG